MGYIEDALYPVAVELLSDQNYEQSFAFYRLWFDIGRAYDGITSDLISDTILLNKLTSSFDPERDKLIHSTAHLIVRFASDAESDRILGPHNSGLQSRLCTRILREFFIENLKIVHYEIGGHSGAPTSSFYANANLIAHWANLGCVEEAAIRNRILQSFISHPRLYDHQANGLIILFKLAGATFGAYVDTSVVDRCFELLKDHYNHNRTKRKLVQEVVELRERGWEGLPPPPVFTTGRLKSVGADQKDPVATPVVTSLGLPTRDLQPQPPPLESVTTLETDTVPVSPVTQSPSISIATLSDFTIADASDGESPIDPMSMTPHDTFYLEDGNAEVLCGNTLFRVHASVLSLHSPVLSRMLAKANLAVAESPNGCPRIPFSDTATDFATLLKIIYLPVFPERNKVPDFTTFSSLLRITAKYEMPAVRSQVLDIIHDAYPETFGGLAPSKPLGESIFSGQTPHPNAVLNLFVQQKLTSALPMAYYMAARRGLGSLMDRCLPANARLPPEILQVVVNGLFALREMELRETHRLIFGSKGSYSCSRSNCPRNTTGPRVSEAHQKVVDRIADSVHSGTKLLQVLSMREVGGGDCLEFCENCVEGWEVGHADVRKNAWVMLPDIFRLNG